MSSECQEDLRRFHESLQRVSQDPAFYERFYRHFIRDSREIAAVFEGRDMADIQKKLKMTLDMVANDADGEPGVDMYLQMLRRVHTRLQISPEMFGQWREALIRTAAESDPLFDETTEDTWRKIIGPVVAKISAGQESQDP